MSVDYLICRYCGDTFADCSSRAVYCDCGIHWCSLECASMSGYDKPEKCDNCGEDDYCDNCIVEELESSCGHCRKEIVSDNEILNYCLNALNTTKEDIINKIKSGY